MIPVSLVGRFAHRLPLAYGPIRDLCAEHVHIVDQVENAKLILLAHSKDIQEYGRELAAAVRADPQKKIVLLSEEPFWDTIWGSDPFSRHQKILVAGESLPLTVLNHATSDIFAFDEIPYFLLTDHGFAPRYAHRFRENSRCSPADWATYFAGLPVQAAFIAEKRLNPKFSVEFPAHETYGLCRFRSVVTQEYKTGVVLRSGLGWNTGPRRQEITNWHLDKLLQLDGRCRFVSGLENTHQKNYVSEKFFDAFAVGAVPIYFAAPTHRVHQIAPQRTWINLFGTPPQDAPKSIDTFAFDAAFFTAYRDIQRQLADLFGSPAAMVRERIRFRAALVADLQKVCDVSESLISSIPAEQEAQK